MKKTVDFKLDNSSSTEDKNKRTRKRVALFEKQVLKGVKDMKVCY